MAVAKPDEFFLSASRSALRCNAGELEQPHPMRQENSRTTGASQVGR